MNIGASLLQHIRKLAGASTPDEQLLSDYVARRDGAVFAVLVARHGPMVFNLCRRILHDAHAAEDVYQSTFLVLAENAASIRRRTALAGWLHGVAYRLAIRAKQRGAREVPVSEITASDSATPDHLAWQEMLAILHEELERISDRCRAPLVLCYLQGKTQDEAAQELGWSLGTLRRRLEQGRNQLETRLRGRGVSLPAALAGLLASGGATVPASLQAATLATIQTAIPALAVGSLRGFSAMALLTRKPIVTLALMLGIVGIGGIGLWINGTFSENPPATVPRPIAPPPEDAAIQTDPIFGMVAEAVAAAEPNNFLLLQQAALEAKRGRVAEAARLFQQVMDKLADSEVAARARWLIIVAYNVEDAGDRPAARGLLNQVRQLAGTVRDKQAANEILRLAAVCHAEKIDAGEALSFAKAMPNENTRINLILATATEQARAGDPVVALRIVEQVQAPGPHYKLKAWEAIAAAQLKKGDRTGAEAMLAAALAAVEQIRTAELGGNDGWRYQQMQALGRYAVAQAQAGDREGARATLTRAEKMTEAERRPASLELLAKYALAQAEAGEYAAGARTIQRIDKRIEEGEGDGKQVFLVDALLALGDYDRAAKAALQAGYHEPLMQVCEKLAETGQQEKGIALAREAKTAEARAWGLISVARGFLNRVPAERRPRYEGVFTPTIPDRPANKPPLKKTAPQAPVYDYQDIVRDWENEQKEFGRRIEQAKTEEERKRLREERKQTKSDQPNGDRYAARMLKLARAHPGDPAAIQALEWILEWSPYESHSIPFEEEALALVREKYARDRNASRLCDLAVYSKRLDSAERLIRAVLEQAPTRMARAQACVALARFLQTKADRVRAVQERQLAEDTRRFEQTYGPTEYARLRAANPTAIMAEVEKLYERIVAEFEDVHPPNWENSLGKAAKAALFELRELVVGKTAPEIDGKDLDAKPLRLSDHRGNVVVLTFWATWCGPCRAMIPHEKDLVDRLKGLPFVLLGINGDCNREQLRKWLTDNPLPWRSWSEAGAEDGRGPIAQVWNVSSWPTVYVLDHRGVIRYRNVTGPKLDAAVETLLKEMSAGR